MIHLTGALYEAVTMPAGHTVCYTSGHDQGARKAAISRARISASPFRSSPITGSRRSWRVRCWHQASRYVCNVPHQVNTYGLSGYVASGVHTRVCLRDSPTTVHIYAHGRAMYMITKE